MWSLICAGGSILLVMVFFIFAAMSPDDEASETFAGCLYLIALGISITGLVLGIASKSGQSNRPVTALIGIILNGLIVGMWVLIMVLGVIVMASGGV